MDSSMQFEKDLHWSIGSGNGEAKMVGVCLVGNYMILPGLLRGTLLGGWQVEVADSLNLRSCISHQASLLCY